MPLFLEPDQKFSIVLNCDKDKPIESRPVFFAKSQSIRGQRKISQTLDMLNVPEIEADELFDSILDELFRVLIGWKNIGIEYSKEALEDVLSYSEARELIRLVGYNQNVNSEEKKSSE